LGTVRNPDGLRVVPAAPVLDGEVVFPGLDPYREMGWGYIVGAASNWLFKQGFSNIRLSANLLTVDK